MPLISAVKFRDLNVDQKMATAGKKKSRYERSSFQGLSIIEGERGLKQAAPGSANKKKDFQLYKQSAAQRNERRRRSSSLAQSDQIRDIIATTVAELKGNDDGSVEQHVTAEGRLKEVLKEAKESGYSAERIFGLLGKTSGEGSPDEGMVVPKQSFADGLRKLGFKWKNDEELNHITDRFDLNRDGMISLAEFQHYCYHEIPSVAWKAERQRLEKTADASGDDVGDDDTKFDVKEIRYGAGPDVFNTSKLFWKNKVSVNIKLRYCSDLDIITMQLQNGESKEDYATLYVNKSDCAVDQEALEEAATLAVQVSEETTDESKELIMANVHWEFYSNYITARLNMTKEGESYVPILARLHGDTKSLGIEKPANLVAPQKRSERPSGGLDEFKSTLRSFQRDSRSARTSRQSAQELSSIAESALNEILMEGLGTA